MTTGMVDFGTQIDMSVLLCAPEYSRISLCNVRNAAHIIIKCKMEYYISGLTWKIGIKLKLVVNG